MSNTSKTSWKKEYLRILVSGVESEKDYELAAELIASGYGEGTYKRSNLGDNKIGVMLWKGVTTEGRLFADDLQNKIEKETWRYRIKLFSISAASWLAGIASAVIAAKLIAP